MKDRRRWILGTAFALPVFGIALAFALPPVDEYAYFDKIGTAAPEPQEVLMHYFEDGKYGFQERDGYARRRRWNLPFSESEATRAVDTFLKHHPKWDLTGSGSGSNSEGGPDGKQTEQTSSIYMNDETGDELEFEVETQTRPEKRLLRATVTVSQTRSSLQLRPKVKRWARLAFTR